MKLSDLLRRTQEELKKITKLKVILDPMPLTTSEPHLRLQFIGSEDVGCKATGLKFSLSIVGAGDGPQTFLEKVIEASIALSQFYKNSSKGYLTFFVGEEAVRMNFSEVNPTGIFTQNEYKETEAKEWTYYYTENKSITLIYGDNNES